MISTFWDEREGSADEAVLSLIDEARKAMAQRRDGDFKRSLMEIKDLLSYAMRLLKDGGFNWGLPGSLPQWPPLREVWHHLIPFREEIIRGSNREYATELLGMDYWFASAGAANQCGELFTAGLNGYRLNYQFLNRFGVEELRDLIRDEFTLVAEGLLTRIDPQVVGIYAEEIVKNQERMLSDAMHAGKDGDYQRMHSEFEAWFRFIRLSRDIGRHRNSMMAQNYEALRQDYRIALMGLAGRATVLASSGRILDPSRYINVARETCTRLEQLADDTAVALLHASENRQRFSLWHEWEMQGLERWQARGISVEQYPLAFFSVRLMELVSEQSPTLNLRGRAKQTLAWFSSNGERLESLVHRSDQVDDNRRELAINALEAAVQRDEIEEDYRIIRLDLSPNRVPEFISGVYAEAFARNYVERLFEQANAFQYLSGDADEAPKERLITNQLFGKGFFVDPEGPAPIYYSPIEGDQFGLEIADFVVYRLCEALDSATEMISLLNNPKEFLQAIDQAEKSLSPSREVVVLLAGDYTDLEIALNSQDLEGYEPSWRLPDADPSTEIGRYRNLRILRGTFVGERRVYVLEPGTWGCLLHAQSEDGKDLRVEVNPISAQKAEDLLDADSSYFSNEPNRESKLRKLQAQVHIIIGVRYEFAATDHSRARRIIPS